MKYGRISKKIPAVNKGNNFIALPKEVPRFPRDNKKALISPFARCVREVSKMWLYTCPSCSCDLRSSKVKSEHLAG